MLKSFSSRTQFPIIYTTTKKNFYASNIDFGKNNSYSKTTSLASTYFKDATKQCNKIKTKYKKPVGTQLPWTPQPFREKPHTHDAFVKVERTSPPWPKPVNLQKFFEKEPNENIEPSGGNESPPKIVLKKRDDTKHYDKKKFKIVYPVNPLKYRLGLYPTFKNKRHKMKEIERNPGVSQLETQQKSKAVPRPKLVSNVSFVPPPFINKEEVLVPYDGGEKWQRDAKYEIPSALVTVHPVLKKANYQNKMSIKKKYNLLLLKNTKKAPAKKTSSHIFREYFYCSLF